MPNVIPQVSLSSDPDRLIMLVGPDEETDRLATQAVYIARSLMPKVTGYMANTLQPVYGDGFFGIYFPDRKVWFLEQGTRAFTMNNLAGKVIPMWIDDPTGIERKNNPKSKTRVTMDGRTQVLIFRRAALKGQRKAVMKRNKLGVMRATTVPMSYPGAAGRIARREAAAPRTTLGKLGGRIAGRNVGVRWRHPGITAKQFLNAAIGEVALDAGISPVPCYACDEATFYALIRS